MERRKKREGEDEEYRRRQKLEDRCYQEERDQKKLQIETLKDALTVFFPGNDAKAFVGAFNDWIHAVGGMITQQAIFVKFQGKLKGAALS